jgi:hypothetical protein
MWLYKGCTDVRLRTAPHEHREAQIRGGAPEVLDGKTNAPERKWKPWHSIPRPRTQGPMETRAFPRRSPTGPWKSIFSPHLPHGATPISIPGKTEESRPVKACHGPHPLPRHADGTAEREQLRAGIRNGRWDDVAAHPWSPSTCACTCSKVLSPQPPSMRTTGSRYFVSRLQARSN